MNANTPEIPAAPDDRQYGMPSPTPLSAPPDVTPLEAVEMLRIAAQHVGELGGQDRAVIAWLAGHLHHHYDAVAASTTATLASLIRRSWSAGVDVGRAERLDEAPAIPAPLVVCRSCGHGELAELVDESAVVAAAHRATQDLADSVLALLGRVNADPDDVDLLFLLPDDITRAVQGWSAGTDRLAKAGEWAVARYRAVLAKSADAADAYASRQLALTVAVDVAVTMLDSDAELAAAVRSIVAEDQAQDAETLAALHERHLTETLAALQDAIRPELTGEQAEDRPSDAGDAAAIAVDVAALLAPAWTVGDVVTGADSTHCVGHRNQTGTVTAIDGPEWTRVAFADGSYCEGPASAFIAAVNEVRPELTVPDPADVVDPYAELCAGPILCWAEGYPELRPDGESFCATHDVAYRRLERRCFGEIADQGDDDVPTEDGAEDAEDVDHTYVGAVAAPVEVDDVMRVHGGRLYPIACRTPSCCDPEGEVLVDNPDVAALLTELLGGAAVSRDDLVAAFNPAADDVLAAVKERLDWLAEHPPTPAEIVAYMRQAHNDRTDGPRPLTAPQAALLLYGLNLPYLRDYGLAWHDDAAKWLWETLVPMAPPSVRAPAATMVAYVAMARGDGALANIALSVALAAAPNYRFARMLGHLAQLGTQPADLTDLIRQGCAGLPVL